MNILVVHYSTTSWIMELQQSGLLRWWCVENASKIFSLFGFMTCSILFIWIVPYQNWPYFRLRATRSKEA